MRFKFRPVGVDVSVLTASTLLSFAVVQTAAFADAVWQPGTSLPVAKAQNFVVNFEGSIYSVGGAPWRNGGDEDGSVFHLGTTGWVEDMPLVGMGPTVDQVGGVDDLGRILAFGGHVIPSGDIGSSRAYLPSKGTTEDLPALVNYPFDYVATAVDGQGRVYSIGGGYGPNGLNYGQVGRWIGSENRWENLAYLPYTRASVAAAYDGDGHIWSFGGYTSFGTWRIVDTSRYDIATNTWTNHGQAYLPIATADGQAVLGANGLIYIIGGTTGSGAAGPVTSAVWIFDPTTITLSPGPALAMARKDFGAALGSDKFIYVVGGLPASGIATTSVERLYTGVCAQSSGLPASVVVAQGATLTLQASVSGDAPITLRWRRGGVDLADGGRVAGSTAATLSITGFTASDQGEYVLVASNPCGESTSTAVLVSLAVTTPADLNHDGVVSGADLGLLLAAWGLKGNAADLNGDGVVGAADLAELLAVWGPVG